MYKYIWLKLQLTWKKRNEDEEETRRKKPKEEVWMGSSFSIYALFINRRKKGHLPPSCPLVLPNMFITVFTDLFVLGS